MYTPTFGPVPLTRQLGQAQRPSPWGHRLNTDLHFGSTEACLISLPIASFLTPNMASNVIIGTNFLDHHHQAIVNLDDDSGFSRGRSSKTQLRNTTPLSWFAVLRSKETYHLLPGHKQMI